MYALVDIGGTKTRIARSRDLESFEDPKIVDTPEDDAALVALVAAEVRALHEGQELHGVSIGKPIYKSGGLEEALRRAVGAPVAFENDTALVGLGEAHYGAGRGARIFVYVTISTGVNGVPVVEGRIAPSRWGFEIGGQYVSESTLSLEEQISGTAIHKRFGVPPRELGLEHAVWEELARTTARGLHNTILHWSPERVAIGGSMVNHIGISVSRVQEHVRTLMRKFPGIPDIVHSELGDLGGLWGGMARLRQEHLDR